MTGSAFPVAVAIGSGACYGRAPTRGERAVVDQFLELAVHIKLASEVVVAAAEQLPVLRPDEPGSAADAWSRIMDGLIALNIQLGFMERLLRAAVRERAPAPARLSGSH